MLGAKWDWCDLDAGVMRIPAEASKEGDARGEERLVALSPQAVELLRAHRKAQLAEGSRSEWIFATKGGQAPARRLPQADPEPAEGTAIERPAGLDGPKGEAAGRGPARGRAGP